MVSRLCISQWQRAWRILFFLVSFRFFLCYILQCFIIYVSECFILDCRAVIAAKKRWRNVLLLLLIQLNCNTKWIDPKCAFYGLLCKTSSSCFCIFFKLRFLFCVMMKKYEWYLLSPFVMSNYYLFFVAIKDFLILMSLWFLFPFLVLSSHRKRYSRLGLVEKPLSSD